jgi:hypothetical protein
MICSGLSRFRTLRVCSGLSPASDAQGLLSAETLGIVSEPILLELPSTTRNLNEAVVLSFSTNSSNGIPYFRRL